MNHRIIRAASLALSVVQTADPRRPHLLELEVVDDGGLAGVVEAHTDDPHFHLAAREQAAQPPDQPHPTRGETADAIEIAS